MIEIRSQLKLPKDGWIHFNYYGKGEDVSKLERDMGDKVDRRLLHLT